MGKMQGEMPTCSMTSFTRQLRRDVFDDTESVDGALRLEGMIRFLNERTNGCLHQ